MSPQIVEFILVVVVGALLKLIDAKKKKTDSADDDQMAKALLRELNDCQEHLDEMEAINNILRDRKESL